MAQPRSVAQQIKDNIGVLWKEQDLFPDPVIFIVDQEPDAQVWEDDGATVAIFTEPHGIIWARSARHESIEQAEEHLLALTESMVKNKEPLGPIGRMPRVDSVADPGAMLPDAATVEWSDNERAAVLELSLGRKLSAAEIAAKLYPRSEAEVTSELRVLMARRETGTTKDHEWMNYEVILLRKLRDEQKLMFKEIAPMLPYRNVNSCFHKHKKLVDDDLGVDLRARVAISKYGQP